MRREAMESILRWDGGDTEGELGDSEDGDSREEEVGGELLNRADTENGCGAEEAGEEEEEAPARLVSREVGDDREGEVIEGDDTDDGEDVRDAIDAAREDGEGREAGMEDVRREE